MNSVLIETYWNVKMIKWSDEEPWLIVLIETYWNVKVRRASDRQSVSEY